MMSLIDSLKLAGGCGAMGLLLGGIAQGRRKRRRTESELSAAREVIDRLSHEQWTYFSARFHALSASLDYHQTLKAVACMLVPDEADVCVVDFKDGNDRLTRAIHRDDPGERPGDELLLDVSPDQVGGPVKEVLKSGVLRSLSGVRDPFSAGGRNCSILSLPLKARGSVVGAITLVRYAAGFTYNDIHCRLVEHVCSRAVLAIDNARLYERAQREIEIRERVLALISHDLKNPLLVMNLSVRYLSQRLGLQNPESTPHDRQVIDRMLNSIERMKALVNSLLDAAKIRSGSFSVACRSEPLLELLEDCYKFGEAPALEKNIRLILDPPPEDCRVMVDRQAFFRVFSNILGNAIEFTPRGGVIRIEAKREEKEVILSIIDSGPGIKPENIHLVFNEFWQDSENSTQGTGLGLMIAKGIIEAHGGRIWAESGSGEGATFRFTVPRILVSQI